MRADFSVFAPRAVEPGRSFILELWTAASTDHDLMIEQATCNNRMVERGDRNFVDIERDILITAILRLPDFEVAESIETLGWDGSIRNIGFIVKAPEMLRPGHYPGMMRLLRQQVPFASITFDIEVATGLSHIAPPARIDAHVQRIERVFASYASHDRPEVLRRVQGIEAAGVRVFVDIMRLKAGQAWEPTLYREIDSSDGLFLFWSRWAAQSGWVEREWRYALEKKGLDFINPVPLEDPRFAPPPPPLQSKHFNDMVLASISLEEQIKWPSQPRDS